MKTETIHKAETAEHTPGPWKYIGTMNGGDLIVFSQGVHFDEATAINGGLGYVATVHTRDVGLDIQNTSSDANARLIAAAPDLLAALQHAETALISWEMERAVQLALSETCNTSSFAALMEAITAAIAKAKGSQ